MATRAKKVKPAAHHQNLNGATVTAPTLQARTHRMTWERTEAAATKEDFMR
jgi:hypothetical protein